MGYLVQQQAPLVMFDYKMINVSFVSHQREKGGRGHRLEFLLGCRAAHGAVAARSSGTLHVFARCFDGDEKWRARNASNCCGLRACRAKFRRPGAQRFECCGLRAAGQNSGLAGLTFREAIMGEGPPPKPAPPRYRHPRYRYSHSSDHVDPCMANTRGGERACW